MPYITVSSYIGNFEEVNGPTFFSAELPDEIATALEGTLEPITDGEDSKASLGDTWTTPLPSSAVFNRLELMGYTLTCMSMNQDKVIWTLYKKIPYARKKKAAGVEEVEVDLRGLSVSGKTNSAPSKAAAKQDAKNNKAGAVTTTTTGALTRGNANGAKAAPVKAGETKKDVAGPKSKTAVESDDDEESDSGDDEDAEMTAPEPVSHKEVTKKAPAGGKAK